MSGDAQMILGDWLSLCNPVAQNHMQTGRPGWESPCANGRNTGTHASNAHVCQGSHVYTHTLINKCMKEWANSHTIARWRVPLSDTQGHSGFSHLPNVNSATPQWQHPRTEEGHTERDIQREKEGLCVCIYHEGVCTRGSARGGRGVAMFCHICSHQG